MLGLFANRQQQKDRPRLVHQDWPGLIYAIGDVHGCLAQLKALEAAILRDCESSSQPGVIVLLGDYVDRGPDSAGVLDYLTMPGGGPLDRICLAGNHEEMFADFIADPRPQHSWLQFGGYETLRSYGLNPSSLFEGGRRLAAQRLESHIPGEHLDFISQLPACMSVRDYTFVHAGLMPGVAIERQRTRDMLWMRPESGAYELPQPFGTVVHGHTPAAEPVREPYRINVDTGAFATGTLTAVRLAPDGNVSFLSVSGELGS